MAKSYGTVAGACVLMLLPFATATAQYATTKDKGTMQEQAKATVLAQGTLAGAGGHHAAGAVHLFETGGKRQLHFTGEFQTEKGGDVEVLLSPQPAPAAGAVMVGMLKAFSGEQIFDVPPRADLAASAYVVLFDKRSNLVLGTAALSGSGMGMMGDKMKDKDAMTGDKMKPKDAMTAKPR